jgi:hypothetical protein
MSTVPLEAVSITDEALPKLLFNYPDADIILRSQDSYLFRVPKTSIISNSPILSKLIQKALDSSDHSSDNANAEAPLPVVQLPESGEILHCLLTFIFLVTPLIPSTPEDIMKLLSVAQNYQMGTVLTHIRGNIALQNLFSPRLEPALHNYARAQKYGLRQEALQTARAVLLKQSLTIEDFDSKLDIIPGSSLYELWKYHERVRDILALDLTEFRISRARGTIAGLRCSELSSFQIPSWLDQYIESIAKTPSLFDYAELNTAMVCHIKNKADDRSDRPTSCECASIPSRTIRDFWEALESVVESSFEKVGVVDIRSCL